MLSANRYNHRTTSCCNIVFLLSVLCYDCRNLVAARKTSNVILNDSNLTGSETEHGNYTVAWTADKTYYYVRGLAFEIQFDIYSASAF